jgi:hypothetical protein
MRSCHDFVSHNLAAHPFSSLSTVFPLSCFPTRVLRSFTIFSFLFYSYPILQSQFRLIIKYKISLYHLGPQGIIKNWRSPSRLTFHLPIILRNSPRRPLVVAFAPIQEKRLAKTSFLAGPSNQVYARRRNTQDPI